MALCKLERINYGKNWPASIKYRNLHSFKEGLILLRQSILEARRITHLHDSAHFTIPLNPCDVALVRNKKEQFDLLRSLDDGIYVILNCPFDFSIK